MSDACIPAAAATLPPPDIPYLAKAQTHLDAAGLPISVRALRQSDLSLHRHEFTELVIVVGGGGDHYLDTDRFPIVAGDVFVIDVDHAHGYSDTRDLQIVNVLFDEPYVLEREPALAAMASYRALVHLEPRARRRLGFEGKLRLDSATLADARQLAHRIRQELAERREGYAAAASALLVELLVLLCRAYPDSDDSARRDLTDIGRVIGHLEERYDEPVELADLLDLVAMSERSLLRKFSDATGTTPIQYLLRVRVTHGARLLRTSSLSVTEVAGRVGFDDSNYFSRRFRHFVGMSPREYRRALASAPVSESASGR